MLRYTTSDLGSVEELVKNSLLDLALKLIIKSFCLVPGPQTCQEPHFCEK